VTGQVAGQVANGPQTPTPVPGTLGKPTLASAPGTPLNPDTGPANNGAAGSASAESGKREHSSVIVKKDVDNASPQMFGDAVQGQSTRSMTTLAAPLQTNTLPSALQTALPNNGAGRQTTITVMKKPDASSAALRQAMASGELLQGVLIEVYRPGSTDVTQRIQLQQTRVTSMQVSGDPVPVETIAFTGVQTGN